MKPKTDYEHTPTPWYVVSDDGCTIKSLDAEPVYIGETHRGNNAEFIVHCVNTHYQREALVEELLFLAKSYLEWVELDSRLRLTKIPEGIRETIAKAEALTKPEEAL